VTESSWLIIYKEYRMKTALSALALVAPSVLLVAALAVKANAPVVAKAAAEVGVCPDLVSAIIESAPAASAVQNNNLSSKLVRR
jgi:hypothetical protein